MEFYIILKVYAEIFSVPQTELLAKAFGAIVLVCD